jgi:hypothetical protein
MAYVPGYEHDLFVSYAQVDDEPEPGETTGWVTTLVTALKKQTWPKARPEQRVLALDGP